MRPLQLSGATSLSLGATSWVYQINDRIVLKALRRTQEEKYIQERKAWDLLELYPWCPDVVQSFLRCPDGNFLSFCSGGTLDQRLRTQQLRDGPNPSHSKLLSLTKKRTCHPH